MRAGGGAGGDFVFEKEAALPPEDRWARGYAIRVMSDNPKEPRVLCYIDVWSGFDSVRSIVQRVCGTLHEQDILPDLKYTQFGLRIHHDHPLLAPDQQIKGGNTVVFCSTKGQLYNPQPQATTLGKDKEEEGMLVGYVPPRSGEEEVYLSVPFTTVAQGLDAISKWMCEMLSLNPAVHVAYTDAEGQSWLVHVKDSTSTTPGMARDGSLYPLTPSGSFPQASLGMTRDAGDGGQYRLKSEPLAPTNSFPQASLGMTWDYRDRLTPVKKARSQGLVIDDDRRADELLEIWDEEVEQQYQATSASPEKKKKISWDVDIDLAVGLPDLGEDDGEQKELGEVLAEINDIGDPGGDGLVRIVLPNGETITYDMGGEPSKSAFDAMLDLCMIHGYKHGEWGLRDVRGSLSDIFAHRIYRGCTYRMAAFIRPRT